MMRIVANHDASDLQLRDLAPIFSYNSPLYRAGQGRTGQDRTARSLPAMATHGGVKAAKITLRSTPSTHAFAHLVHDME